MNHTIKNYQGQSQQKQLVCLKFYKWAMENNIKSLKMVIADDQYYKKTYQQRRDILGAPSIQYLCKTIVFENTAYDEKYSGEFYPKYLAVVVQYVAKINSQKLNKMVRYWQQKNVPNNKASKAYFNYRLAEGAQNQLTGYSHNSVTPILMKTKMPIIVSHKISKLKPQFFWMGGGHPDIKMRLSLQEFKVVYPDKVLIEDITYEDDA